MSQVQTVTYVSGPYPGYVGGGRETRPQPSLAEHAEPTAGCRNRASSVPDAWPLHRFAVRYPRQETYAKIPLVRICAEAPGNRRPYREPQ